MKKAILLINICLATFQTLSGQPESKTYKVKFEDLVLSFVSTDIWTPDSVFSKTVKDSLTIELGLDDNFENKALTIKRTDPDISQITMFEYIITSMSVGDEGAHLDLIDWKHYKTDPVKLKNEKDIFTTWIPGEKISTKFPSVSKTQILTEVENSMEGKDNKFYKRALECSGPTGYPCYVSISQIVLILEIQFRNGTVQKRIIRINVPMGC